MRRNQQSRSFVKTISTLLSVQHSIFYFFNIIFIVLLPLLKNITSFFFWFIFQYILIAFCVLLSTVIGANSVIKKKIKIQDWNKTSCTVILTLRFEEKLNRWSQAILVSKVINSLILLPEKNLSPSLPLSYTDFKLFIKSFILFTW